MTKQVEVNGATYEVDFNSWVEGSYRRGSRFEPEEFPELFWEIDEVRDENGDRVDDPEILQSVEDACLLIAHEIDELCAESHS